MEKIGETYFYSGIIDVSNKLNKPTSTKNTNLPKRQESTATVNRAKTKTTHIKPESSGTTEIGHDEKLTVISSKKLISEAYVDPHNSTNHIINKGLKKSSKILKSKQPLKGNQGQIPHNLENILEQNSTFTTNPTTSGQKILSLRHSTNGKITKNDHKTMQLSSNFFRKAKTKLNSYEFLNNNSGDSNGSDGEILKNLNKRRKVEECSNNYTVSLSDKIIDLDSDNGSFDEEKFYILPKQIKEVKHFQYELLEKNGRNKKFIIKTIINKDLIEMNSNSPVQTADDEICTNYYQQPNSSPKFQPLAADSESLKQSDSLSLRYSTDGKITKHDQKIIEILSSNSFKKVITEINYNQILKRTGGDSNGSNDEILKVNNSETFRSQNLNTRRKEEKCSNNYTVALSDEIIDLDSDTDSFDEEQSYQLPNKNKETRNFHYEILDSNGNRNKKNIPHTVTSKDLIEKISNSSVQFDEDEKTTKYYQKPSFLPRYQLPANSESLKQSDSLSLSHTIYDDKSNPFISCKHEYCDTLVEEPDLLIDDLYCSLACKYNQTLIEEKHYKEKVNFHSVEQSNNKIQPATKSLLPNSSPGAIDDDDNIDENNYFDLKRLTEEEDVLKYMSKLQLKSAPIQLFDKPFPTEKNLFVVGQKLEGIDPKYEALFCVMTVSEVCGYRFKLHFDGYEDEFDFWVNADYPDLFPSGWCKMNSRILQPPLNYGNIFDWNLYLKECQSLPAPKHNFASTKTLNRFKNTHKFQIGGKLEALDKLTRTHSKQLIYVATVADILGNRVRIHFDGWTDDFDYWADIASTYIHPIGWCESNGRTLIPPSDYTGKKRRKPFNWTEYLAETNSEPVPKDAFGRRPLRDFTIKMRVEVVDLVVPRLLRIAKVVDVRGDELKIVYDGFDNDYAYWIEDDSPDIHPVGWSSKTNHPIELPPASNTLWSCNIRGCKGHGNSSNLLKTNHVETKDCPYQIDLWETAIAGSPNMPDRLKIHNVSIKTTLTSSKIKSSKSG